MVYTPTFNKVLYFDMYNYAAYMILLYIIPLTILATLNIALIVAIKHSRERHREITVMGGARGVCHITAYHDVNYMYTPLVK